MNKKFVWLSALVVSLIAGQPAIACKTTSKHCHCNEQKIASHLNLTSEQKVKIKEIRAKSLAVFNANYKQLKALRAQIHDLAKAEKIDEAKLDSLIAQKNKIQGIMLKNHVLTQHQIYNLLDAKQKLQFQKMKKAREAIYA